MITTRSEMDEVGRGYYQYIYEQGELIVDAINRENIDIELINNRARDIQKVIGNIAQDLKRYRHQKEKEARRRR